VVRREGGQAWYVAYINNLFEERQPLPGAVVAKFATTAADGKAYQVDHYNLDVIISVGYRVKSQRGTQFRIWATHSEFLCVSSAVKVLNFDS
jgi:hypothetical protein